MKISSLIITTALLGLLGTSCQSQRNLAQFGDFRLSAFGNKDVESESRPDVPTTMAAAQSSSARPTQAPAGTPTPTPVISDSDPVVAMARAQAAGETVAAPAMLAPVQTSPSTPMPSAAPAYASVPSATSTLESAQDLGYTIPNQFVVKTTAYTHYEADHVQYGAKTATGENLKYGTVRSAAADWSRYPVGTRFKIKGLPYEYVVDDYGRALVGTDTIDLYKPDSNYMNQWGARDVGIEVLEWGSFEESKRILEGRKNKPDADHVRRMLRNIEEKIDKIPAQLRDGFRA